MDNEILKRRVDELTSIVEEMERQVVEVTRMRASIRRSKTLAAKAALEQSSRRGQRFATPATSSSSKDEILKNKQLRSKRMADLIRMSSNILRQIMNHKWAWPFLHPVDAEALGLHDYHQVIKRPMDLGTIRDQIEGKEDVKSTYHHPQHICDDVRLVFSNAILYNQEGSDVHVMAKTLSQKFEEKWNTVMIPRLEDEESKRQQEDEEMRSKGTNSPAEDEEHIIEKNAQKLNFQLDELDKQLEEIKAIAAIKCRPMTAEEKRSLGYDLGLLQPHDLNRMIQIIAENQPSINLSADEFEVDIDAQDPATLWRLHRFVHNALHSKTNGLINQGKSGLILKKDMTGLNVPAIMSAKKRKWT